MTSPRRRRWRTEDRQDLLLRRTRPSWWVFLLAPLMVALAGAALVVISILVGSALIGVFIYSFAVAGAIAVYIGLREFLAWVRR